ncbi:hypothetical protein AAFC00_005799 [Neodothiora populina]|uniref:Outer spore wall protein RRT8 n=1 Tax=Neodothiora populina TaxID=2781224 RepID=A0ABR3P5V6_9PEZI
MTAKDKIKETARQEAERVGNMAGDAARSGAYLYPLKGIYYYATHRALWKPLATKLLPTIGLGLSVFAGMFFFTYLPQAAVLAIFNGPLAALSAALLVLSESSTIFNVMARALLVEDSLIDTFDGTLIATGETTLVSHDRQVKSGSNPIGRLGKLAAKPFAKFTPSAIIRYLMYLPLNFIPVVGTVMFVLLQGKRQGPAAHARYFQLKGMSKQRREEWVEKRRGAYTSFGTVASLLEMVPIAGILFAFTNTTGAALWAAELEKSGQEGTSPTLREQAKKAS